MQEKHVDAQGTLTSTIGRYIPGGEENCLRFVAGGVHVCIFRGQTPQLLTTTKGVKSEGIYFVST